MPARTRTRRLDPAMSAGKDPAMTPEPASPVPPLPGGLGIMSDALEGTDPDGNPTGLLMWGQAGIYNGVDDRAVITAVTDNAIGGIVRPPGLSAGPGLALNVAGGWVAVASCGDGTNAVVRAAITHQVQVPAGAPGVTRRDLLWCDTYPDDGRWVLRVIREAEMPGRPGLPLARITVPPGANLASQMTFTHDVHFLSPKVDSDPRSNHGTGTYTDLTPPYPFALYGIRRDAMFRLTAYGVVDVGSGTAGLRWRIGGATLDWTPATLGGGMANRLFHWDATAVVIFGSGFAAGVGNTKLTVTVSRASGRADPGSTLTATRYAGSVGFGAGPWLTFGLQAAWLSAMPNANIVCQSSAFEAVGKPW